MRHLTLSSLTPPSAKAITITKTKSEIIKLFIFLFSRCFLIQKNCVFFFFVKLESFESFKSNDGLAFLFVLFYTIFFYNLQFLVLSIVKFVFVRFENVYRMCWMSKRCLKDCLITCFCLPFFRSRADLDIDIAVC